MPDDRCPRPASRIRGERLAVLADQRDDSLEAVLLHVGQMLGKALVTVNAISGATDRPVEDHA